MLATGHTHRLTASSSVAACLPQGLPTSRRRDVREEDSGARGHARAHAILRRRWWNLHLTSVLDLLQLGVAAAAATQRRQQRERCRRVHDRGQ
jgi:hypothetical protein